LGLVVCSAQPSSMQYRSKDVSKSGGWHGDGFRRSALIDG
jgi:hypothetical protein